MRLILSRVMVVCLSLFGTSQTVARTFTEDPHITQEISFPESYYRTWESHPSHFVSTYLDEVFRAKAILSDYIAPQSTSLIPFNMMRRAFSFHWNRHFVRHQELIRIIRQTSYLDVFDLALDMKHKVFNNTTPTAHRSSLFQRVRFILYQHMTRHSWDESPSRKAELLRFYFTTHELDTHRLH